MLAHIGFECVDVLTAAHKMLGRIYLISIAAAGLITPCMPARIGQRSLDYFGVIYVLTNLFRCQRILNYWHDALRRKIFGLFDFIKRR